MFSFPKFPTVFVLSACLGVSTLPVFGAEAVAAPDSTPEPTGSLTAEAVAAPEATPAEEAADPASLPTDPNQPQAPLPPQPAGTPAAPVPAAPPVDGSLVDGKARPEAPAPSGPEAKAAPAVQPDLAQSAWNIAPGVSMVRGSAALGPVRAATIVTKVSPNAPVTVAPVHAGGGSIRGLDTVPNMARRNNALMMINGGFWKSGPGGNPNGTWIVNGQMLSEPESQGVGPRGTIGWLNDGRVVVDRISANLTVSGPNGLNVKVNGINRDWRRTPDATSDPYDAVIAYNATFGGPVRVQVPAGSPSQHLTAVRVKANAWPATGSVSAKVVAVNTGKHDVTVPGDEVLITGRGATAQQLAGLKVGQTVSLNSQLVPMDPARAGDWTQVHTAVAGGPQVLRNGQVTAPADWVSEGFEPRIHSNVRHPRTAIGRTANNETVMITADGRQPGYSVGLTMQELGQYMASQGVVDAVSLDGGGSTQVTVGSRLVNRPCCDRSLRRVADGIALLPREQRAHRVKGAERVATAAKAATTAFTAGKTPTVVLARADAYADALSGAGLAGAVGGPVLLAHRDRVPEETLKAMKHLGTTHVAMLGGRAALGDAVEDQLKKAGFQVVRVSGPGRADTAAEAARAIALQVRKGGGKVDHAFVVAGDQWADSLVAGAAAGLMKSPILLTNARGLDGVTAQVLNDIGIKKVTLVGDTNRLSPQLETDMKVRKIAAERIGQPNPYATSVQMNEWMKGKVGNLNTDLVVATGENFPDGLAAGPMAARKRVPLALVPGRNLNADPLMVQWIARNTNPKSKIYVLGGSAVIPDDQFLMLDRLGAAGKAGKNMQDEVAEAAGVPFVAEAYVADRNQRLNLASAKVSETTAPSVPTEAPTPHGSEASEGAAGSSAKTTASPSPSSKASASTSASKAPTAKASATATATASKKPSAKASASAKAKASAKKTSSQ